MKICRVINLPKSNGLFNTVIDEYFLSKKDLDFIILFTEWSPTVSIGNSQSVALDINLNAVKKYGLDLVRRRSGGQSVLVDEEYIVFSLIGRRCYFPQDLTLLRKQITESVASALREVAVPAEYSEPDNVIVRNPGIQTLGNAAQIVRQYAVAVHGSIRYSLSDDSLTRMVETLMINGISLAPYREQVRKVLSCVRKFSDTGKEDVKAAILQKLLGLYGFQSYHSDCLSEPEIRGIKRLLPDPIEEKPGCRSRGVCYLYLNGKCLLTLPTKLGF